MINRASYFWWGTINHLMGVNSTDLSSGAFQTTSSPLKKLSMTTPFGKNFGWLYWNSFQKKVLENYSSYFKKLTEKSSVLRQNEDFKKYILENFHNKIFFQKMIFSLNTLNVSICMCIEIYAE